jgi:hypothetical protein
VGEEIGGMLMDGKREGRGGGLNCGFEREGEGWRVRCDL